MKKIFYDKQQCIFYAIALIIFCLILLLNCLTPMAADDYFYTFVRGTTERVDSFSDVFVSMWRYYFEWGGRVVVHSIAQIFLWWGKPIFNIFNSVIFIVYVNLISCFSFGKRSIIGILCSFLIVWLFIPVPGSVFFWLDGACNYLWGTTFILLLIYRYYNDILENKSSQKENFLLVPLWFLFGIITGWCNENTSGMGIFVCCLLTLYGYKKNKRVPFWKITGILGAVLGFSLMIVAPGNSIRSGSFDVPANPLKRLFEGFVRTNKHGFGLSGNNRTLFLVFLFAYLFILILPKVSKEKKIIGGIWFLGALACNYAMTFSPYYPDRASFGVFSMYFVSILYSSRALIEYFNVNILKDIVKALLCVSFLYFLVSYSIATCDIGLTYIQNSRRIETVLEEKSKGNYDITVPKMKPITKYNVFSSVTDWPQYSVAKYFGVDSIHLKK